MQRLKYGRFVCVPSKPTNRASSELGTPQGTVWRGLRRRLLYKPYRLQLLQALRPNDKERSHAGNDRRLCVSTAFSFTGELTFHLSGKVNGHFVRIWSLQNPLTLAKRDRLGKENVFSVIHRQKVYGSFFLSSRTVRGILYILDSWLFSQLMEGSKNYIF